MSSETHEHLARTVSNRLRLLHHVSTKSIFSLRIPGNNSKSYPPHRHWTTKLYRRDREAWFVFEYNQKTHRQSIRKYFPMCFTHMKELPADRTKALSGDLNVEYSLLWMFSSRTVIRADWYNGLRNGPQRHTRLLMISLLSKDGLHAAPNDKITLDSFKRRPHCRLVKHTPVSLL